MKPILQYIIIFVLLSRVVHAQNIVNGIIKDETGLPVDGVIILVKGSSNYVASDAAGRFSISSQTAPPFILRISSIGFKSQEIQIAEIKDTPLQVILATDNLLSEIVVTSRRRSEVLQDVPIPVSVVGGATIEDAGAFNVNRVKELVPTVQLYSSNPRNTTLNVRGLGSTFGLTNDGIDPGVGFYVDGVYYARPAAATLDFVDVEQIEVLRGPQGTLFGKNTTAGAFNITTRKPSFTPAATFEASYGNYGYIQAKSSVTGPLIANKLAARVSFSGTQRDGTIYNIKTLKNVNNLNNLGFRGQLLFTPDDQTRVTLSGDVSEQHPEGYAQVIAGVVKTQRADYRQFDQIISDLNYTLPSQDPFDRRIDHDTPWRSGNELGGLSLNIDTRLGAGILTSTSAWRYWNWDPSNDRDFTGLPVLSLSQATSKHKQLSQEIRYSGNLGSRLSGVIGIFAIGQNLKTDPVHVEESGAAQWRFSQNSTSPLWQTPGLLDGYGIKTTSQLQSFSGAVFGQLDFQITDRIRILPGIRLNYDQKKVNYDRQTYGGLQTTDPALIALKNAIYSNQNFIADAEDINLSGQLTLAYRAAQNMNTYATYSTSYKPVGVNLGGLPSSGGAPMLELAQIRPEYVNQFELGVKTNPTSASTLNFSFHHTNVKDFQAQVQTAELGVNRGYLANAEKVRVIGLEVEGNTRLSPDFSIYGGLAYTDGKYISFTNAPVPLEEVGGASAFKDISGGRFPGISTWAGTFGGELSIAGKLLGQAGKFFIASDTYYRSGFSSSASPSRYLNIDGYALFNARTGFRVSSGISISVWSRNLFNKDYFEQLLPAGGSAGHYAAVIGDPRTSGVTLRYAF